MDIITALVPIKKTVEAHYWQNNNFFTADIAIDFMLKKLNDANSPISKKLYAALKFQMEELHIDFSDLLQYLHNGIDFITAPSSIKCWKLIVNINIVNIINSKY